MAPKQSNTSQTFAPDLDGLPTGAVFKSSKRTPKPKIKAQNIAAIGVLDEVGDGSDGLTCLPVELLTIICKYSEIQDLLNIRLTCRGLNSVSILELGKSFTKIYLHPSNKSIRNFTDICSHPVFSKNITEIIYLSCPYCCFAKISFESFDSYFRRSIEIQTPENARQRIPPSKKRLTAEEIRHSFAVYEAGFKDWVSQSYNKDFSALKRALSTLRRHLTVTCCNQIREFGLNAENVWTTKCYQLKLGERAHSRSVHAWAMHQNPKAKFHTTFNSWASSHYAPRIDCRLIRFLSNTRVSRFRIGRGDDHIVAGRIDIPGKPLTFTFPATPSRTPNAFRALTFFEINTSMSGMTQPRLATWDEFLCGLSGLKHIRICCKKMHDEFDHHSMNQPRKCVIEAFLKVSRPWPTLVSFKVENNSASVRPAILSQDLLTFLDRHKNSLRTLHLLRIDPRESRDGSPVEAVSIWKSLLDKMRYSMTLERASVKEPFEERSSDRYQGLLTVCGIDCGSKSPSKTDFEEYVLGDKLVPLR